MVDGQKDIKMTLREITFKVFKATIKGILFYAIILLSNAVFGADI